MKSRRKSETNDDSGGTLIKLNYESSKEDGNGNGRESPRKIKSLTGLAMMFCYKKRSQGRYATLCSTIVAVKAEIWSRRSTKRAIDLGSNCDSLAYAGRWAGDRSRNRRVVREACQTDSQSRQPGGKNRR